MSTIFDTHKFDVVDLNEANAQAEAYNKSYEELRQEIEIDVAISPEIREEFSATGRLSAENWFMLVYGISLKRCTQIIVYMLVIGVILFTGIFAIEKVYDKSHPLEVTVQKFSEDGTVYYEHTAGDQTWITTEKEDTGIFWEIFNRVYSYFNEDGVYSK